MLGKKVGSLCIRFRLRVGRRAAFGVPGIGNAQLGAGDVFGIRIGVNEGLQREERATSNLLLFIASSARSNKTLSGCFGVQVGQRIRDLFVGTGRAQRQNQTQESDGESAMLFGKQIHDDLERKLGFQQARLCSGLQQLSGIYLWITVAEHGVACD